MLKNYQITLDNPVAEAKHKSKYDSIRVLSIMLKNTFLSKYC